MPSLLTTINAAKESGQTFQPLLLVEIGFSDGSVLRLSTHDFRSSTSGVQWNGNDYWPRIVNSDAAAGQALSSLGIDTIPYVTLKLADADRTLWQSYEKLKGFDGASVVFRFVFYDVVNKTFSSDSLIKFVGICEAPSNDDNTLTVRCMSKMNMAKVYLPYVQIQRVCPWTFPDTTGMTTAQGQALRQAAADNSSSPCYQCGYSPDATGGNARGNYQTGTTPFTTCDLSYTSCVARLGNSALSGGNVVMQDTSGRATGRFGGISYVDPGSWSGTPWGSSKASNYNPNWDNSQVFNQYMPLIYGTAMIYPPVINVEGDANSTRGECIVSIGQLLDNPTFPVFNLNDHDLQCAQDINGAALPVTDSLRRYNILTNGGRNGALIHDAGINDPDPHGGMVVVEWCVLAAENSSNSAPTIRTVVMGQKVPAFQAFTSIVSGHLNCTGNLLFGEGTPVTITGTGSALDGVTYQTLNNTSTGVDLVGCTGSCGAGYFGGAIKDTAQALGSTPTGLANSDNSNVTEQFINGCGANPVWVIMDLMIKAGWTYGDFDMAMWIAAAAICDRQITDDSGATHALFSTSLVLKDPKSIADLVRGVRLSCRATLMPSLRNATNQGLLGIMIEQTLADQQPSAIAESNYATAVASIDHTGASNNGYVAYRFSDDNGTILRKNKKSTLQITQQPINNSYNSVTFSFQDSQNSYVTDTITVRDSAAINNVGQEVSYSLPVLGTNTYDGSQRAGSWFLGKILQGNPRGDSKGTWHFKFETSFRAAHLMIGDLIMVNSVHDGISNAIARVTSATPTTDWETMTVEADWHLDQWCMDAFGEVQFTSVTVNANALVRPPLPWSPNQAAPVNTSDPLGQALTFDISQIYTNQNGTIQPQLVINGQNPSQSLSALVIPPLFDMTATITPATGTIAGGQYWSLAICTQDAAGLWSKPSNVVNVSIPSGLNTYSIKLTGLNWQTYAGQTNTAYGVFMGPDNNHMTLQGSPSSTFGTSVTVSSYSTTGIGLPDSEFDHFTVKVIQARHTGSTGFAVTGISGSVVTAGATWTVNCFANRVLSFIATFAGGVETVKNYHIVSNTATTITVTGNPQTDGVQIGDVLVVRLGVTTATVNSTQDTAWNGGDYPMTVNAEAGKVQRFISGTNKGQTYTIASNTADTVTIQGQYSTIPDTTSIWIITEPGLYDSVDGQSMPITVDVANETGSTILIEVDTVDSTGQECANNLSPVRDIYVYGAQGTRTITTSQTQVSTDGRIFANSSAGSIVYTLLPDGSVFNQELFVQKLGSDTNTVTVQCASGDTFSDGTTSIILSNPGDSCLLQF